jgi:hypothetical protein
VRAFEATATIAADPEAIWAILTDGPAYPAWDSGVVRVDGRIAPGESITVVSAVNPGRTFPLRVTEFVPGQRMAWTGGLPLGLFTGVRTFALAPAGDRTTRFTMREEYRGPLAPLIGRTIPDLGPSFGRFAAGLKARAEGADTEGADTEGADKRAARA